MIDLMRFGLGAIFLATILTRPATARVSDGLVAFEGEKSSWHDGFDRYDYLMDDETLEIKPFRRDEKERFGIADPPAGSHRCVVIVPKQPAPGNPWSWRGCYWDHQPQTEVELLRRGFHVAYISASGTLKPGKQWDAWYAHLTEKHGLSAKPAFIGMSRGGEYSYTWAAANPTKVACIYADNPGMNPETLGKLGALARADVPLLHVCGSIDPLLPRVSSAIEGIYQQHGGRISVMIKEGAGHHPHSLRDPGPIADFITQAIEPASVATPSYMGNRATRTSFHDHEETYRLFPKETNYLTCRGPRFTPCYDRFSFNVNGVEGAITVIVPKAPAPGRPWVFRADYPNPDSSVDLALLANGFHIVTGPVPYNGDGPSLGHWNAVYDLLTREGFSKKPVLEGAGGAAGEAYAWAIANPDKVSCVYGENPVLRCTMSKAQPINGLETLAKAGVPLIHACGSLDPRLDAETRVAELRVKEYGGRMTVLIDEGRGHHPTSPRDPKPVVELILAARKEPPPRAELMPRDYRFEGPISRVVLENYLSRAISMEGLLNGRGDLDDNIRMLKETGAKFIGRALCLWGGEGELLRNLDRARAQVPRVHAADPDMVLQACLFEIVTTQVEQVPVPAWAFAALGLPAEARNFRYADMLYADGRRVDHWRRGQSVPDVSRPETQLWFYFLAASYIDLGIEALHLGQVELMNGNDRDLAHYSRLLGLIRDHASRQGRRHLVICDSHVPGGGLVREGKLLMDFHSFPLRIKEVSDRPLGGILEVGFSDGLYGRSKGGVTASGWSCEHLPYLVELDNWGASRHPGEWKQGGIWVWGYDEITWFAHQSPSDRAAWLQYAWDWVPKADPDGHLQMPGSRTMRSPLDGKRWYYANRPSPAVPDGLGDEEAIRAIWAADATR